MQTSFVTVSSAIRTSAGQRHRPKANWSYASSQAARASASIRTLDRHPFSIRSSLHSHARAKNKDRDRIRLQSRNRYHNTFPDRKCRFYPQLRHTDVVSQVSMVVHGHLCDPALHFVSNKLPLPSHMSAHLVHQTLPRSFESCARTRPCALQIFTGSATCNGKAPASENRACVSNISDADDELENARRIVRDSRHPRGKGVDCPIGGQHDLPSSCA